MNTKFTIEQMVEIFCTVDDLSVCFETAVSEYEHEKLLKIKGGLTNSEASTILILYHYSGYKCFEYYYQNVVRKELLTWFPGAPSYTRFLAYIPLCVDLMMFVMVAQCHVAEKTERYFVDSKKLPVCHNRRIHSNKVFKGWAGRGKSSTGWFYGMKIHLVINTIGDIVSFSLTSANVADNNHSVLHELLDRLKGKVFGDKGYHTTLFQEFMDKDLNIVAWPKAKMKPKMVCQEDKLYLNKRGMIEAVNDILMTVCDIEHTRHRSPLNACTHILASLVAYSFLENKPKLILAKYALNAA